MIESRYAITPNDGFNGVLFGISREKVRSLLGDFREFRKSKFSKNTTDDFGDFHVYYNTDNKVEAVEFFEGEVYIDKTRLFPNSKDELFAVLQNIESSTVLSSDSVISRSLGISAYAPSDIVEAILIHDKKYFG